MAMVHDVHPNKWNVFEDIAPVEGGWVEGLWFSKEGCISRATKARTWYFDGPNYLNEPLNYLIILFVVF
jgi:hypothetical protein